MSMRGMMLVGLLLVMPLGAAAQTAEEAAFNARIDELFAAIGQADVDAAAAVYHEHAVRALGTNITVGRSNLREAMSEEYANGGRQITVTRHATRLPTPDAALSHGNFTVGGAGGGHIMVGRRLSRPRHSTCPLSGSNSGVNFAPCPYRGGCTMSSTCAGCGCVLPPEHESITPRLCAVCDSLGLEPRRDHPAEQEDQRGSRTSDPEDDVQIRLKALEEVLQRHSGRPTA